MPIKNIIARGIGFSPGLAGYIVTHGFGNLIALTPAALTLGDAAVAAAALTDAAVTTIRQTDVGVAVLVLTDGGG